MGHEARGERTMNACVYKKTEPELWTVGFYDPAGEWHSEGDHDSADAAAERVHWLNGGAPVAKGGTRLTLTRSPRR